MHAIRETSDDCTGFEINQHMQLVKFENAVLQAILSMQIGWFKNICINRVFFFSKY